MPKVDIIAGARTISLECEPHEFDAAKTAAGILNAEVAEVLDDGGTAREMSTSNAFMIAALKIAGKYAEATGLKQEAGEASAGANGNKSILVEEFLSRLTGAADLAEEIASALEKKAGGSEDV